MRTKIYEESDYNVMLKTLEELTQGYDSEGNKVAAYFDVHELMDNFGITMEEAIDIAENNGYNVFRLPGGDNLVNQVVIAHGDLSYGDIVKEEESKIEVDDSVEMEDSNMLKQRHEDLKEEVDVSIIGKPVKYRNEDCTIKDVIEEDDDAVIILSNGKQLLASICVARGTLTSDDADVNTFLDKFKVEEQPEVEPEQEKEPEKAVDSKDAVIQQALNDAREDWEEYKESSPMFKMVKKARKTGKYDNIHTAYPELYADTYYKEFYRLIHSVESKLAKNYAGIIERTYPGDVDELIFWLRKAITNIRVTSGDATMAVTQERVDFFNDRDGTNATISRQNNKIFSSWIADLTQKEDLLKDMPIEVLDWKVDKNNGKAFDEDELGLVYNKNNNELGSNAVVLDLLYEYDFKLGKQKTNEELEEGLNNDVRIEYNDLEVELDTEDGLRTKTFHNVSYIVDRDDVLEALERITDLDVEDIEERFDYYVEKYYEDLKDVFSDAAAKAQAEDYEENPDVYESCSADGKPLNEKQASLSTEFANEEDDEDDDGYPALTGYESDAESLLREIAQSLGMPYEAEDRGSYDDLNYESFAEDYRNGKGDEWVETLEEKGLDSNLLQQYKKLVGYNETHGMKDTSNDNFCYKIVGRKGTPTDGLVFATNFGSRELATKILANANKTNNRSDMIFHPNNNFLWNDKTFFDFKNNEYAKPEYFEVVKWKCDNESLEEDTNDEVVEETNEYKIVKTIQHNFKTVNGVARKGKDKVIYQVYFRTQDYNPAVGRWMNRGWTNSTSEHDSIESARAYVKKYGKELKEELKEIQVRDNENIEKDAEECPLPLEIIPNNMGINLSNVEKVKWEEQEDGQLKKIEIDFNPADELEEDIEKHDTLNQKLFDGEELKHEIKEKIEQIAYQFVRELNEDGIRFTLKDIVLLGSNVSYNYTKDSDLDIHLIADSSGLECPDDLYPLLYSAYRSMFNKNYDIRIKGIPAEIYVEMDEPVAKSNGIYSLNNGWLKKPEQRDIPDLDEEAFDKLFNEWEDKYFELMEKDATSEDIENFIEDLYDLRKESIATEGEYGLGNLVFKEFRNLGYLDDLKELRKEKKGKELSLEQLDEELKKTNASKLFKLLNTEVNELNVILSEDVEDRKIDDEKAYNSAKEEVEKGINVDGMWTNPETKEAVTQPNSYIIKCDLDKAKELAKALCQLEFITIEFDDENNFSSKLYHLNDNGYNEVENSSEVVFDDEAKKLSYYSTIDGVAFSLGLYGNNFNLDENNQLEKRVKLEVVPLSTYVNKWSKYSRYGIPKHALEVSIDEFEDELKDKPDALKMVREFFREHPRAYSCIIKYYYKKYNE